MKKSKENIFYVKGNLFINRPFNTNWLSSDKNALVLHAKKDVIFECHKPPNRMKSDDYFLDVDKLGLPIGDIVAFSQI